MKYKKSEASLIVSPGFQITTEIGRRYGRAFRELLFSNHVYLGISNETRTLQTLKAFLHGFEKPLLKSSINERQSLHFHHLNADDDDVEDELLDKYKKSDLLNDVRKSVSKRLALGESLKLKELKQLYQMCASDYNLFNNTFWCNFLKGILVLYYL